VPLSASLGLGMASERDMDSLMADSDDEGGRGVALARASGNTESGSASSGNKGLAAELGFVQGTPGVKGVKPPSLDESATPDWLKASGPGTRPSVAEAGTGTGTGRGRKGGITGDSNPGIASEAADSAAAAPSKRRKLEASVNLADSVADAGIGSSLGTGVSGGVALNASELMSDVAAGQQLSLTPGQIVREQEAMESLVASASAIVGGRGRPVPSVVKEQLVQMADLLRWYRE